MPTVEFYVFESAGRQQALLFACQLIEKAYNQKQQVYLYVASTEEADYLDKLLWIFRDDSFLPHNVYRPSDDFPPPIQIGTVPPPERHRDILINLTPHLPTFYESFKQVIEIVFADPSVQQLARERYKQYREKGLAIDTHKMK